MQFGWNHQLAEVELPVKMKSSLAVLLFVGLVLVFSSEAANDDFDILTPEGDYKQGKFSSSNFEDDFSKEKLLN